MRTKRENINLQLIKRQLFFLLADIFCVMCACYASLLIRNDFSVISVESHQIDAVWTYMPFNILITVIVFWLFHLYSSLWQYASVGELQNVLFAVFVVSAIYFLATYFTPLKMSKAYYILFCGFMFAFTVATRFGYRYMRWRIRMKNQVSNGKKVMIIGAGEAGNIILKEIITSSHLNYDVKCIIDDDERKKGLYMRGVRVIGGREQIVAAAKYYGIEMIIIAIQALSVKDRKEIIDKCKETACIVKILPGVYQLVNDEVRVSRLRNIELEDLLGREEIKVDLCTISQYLCNKVVLVTGGGGSIGSELCRQIAIHQPKQLIIFDIYENNAYDIQQELLRKFPGLNLVVLIGSVRNSKRLEYLFKTYHPQIVYHAAAHKHVPLMENSPNEAIKNNVFGTLKVVMAADRYQSERFVLISTDKAVNPTNIMGASKRICEMIIQAYNHRSTTEFVAVRFGNVLGSNGSVIPLFRKQIEAGGPVTVTHPDIIRYFMTIPEAVSLVIQAGTLANGGEIFVLDMGEPVKIADLAKNLIKLSGYTPGDDIQIVYTGLRPGEKLYEEILMDEEGLSETDNKLIHIGKPIAFDENQFSRNLARLKDAVLSEEADIRELVHEIVPTYCYNKEETDK